MFFLDTLLRTSQLHSKVGKTLLCFSSALCFTLYICVLVARRRGRASHILLQFCLLGGKVLQLSSGPLYWQ